MSRAAFAPYVPLLVAGWTGAPAKELDGSLVSLDISGFTALSERLQTRGRAGAEELVLLVSGVFDGLIAICNRYGGDVLKFRGDALLLFFSEREHELRAYTAAKEMQSLITSAGETMSSVGPVALGMSTGIFNGPCQFFLVDGTHSELVVTGPAASETIRLEDEASSGEILVGGGVPEGEPDPYSAPPVAADGDLERFVPVPMRPQIALDAGEQEHRQVTAAFLKFSGVEELLTEGGLDVVHAELAPLAQLVGGACADLGVTWLESDIDKNGGKFYLVGGAPSSTGEDEECVLRAVHRVLDEYDGKLVVRAGINRGNAFCGDIGAQTRRTYAVMGDTVNLAARLTGRAEPGEALVTGDVLDRARTRYESRSESFLVKGKERPVTGYHLGAATGVRQEDASELPLVGRDAELASLKAAVDDARANRQRLVELVGEPGIGKSRLVEALKEQGVGFAQLIARCDTYAAATPYFAFRALLRPLAGLTLDLDENTAGARLTSWIQAALPDLAPWLPLLAIPFGAQVPSTPETDQIDPAFRRERLHDAVEQFFAHVLLTPTLIIVEDTHWADDASFELLRYLIRQPAPRPWLVCATRRPQGPSLAAAVSGHESLALERLGADAARSLALAVAGELALSTDDLAAVGERSGGNPLFLRELVGAARSAGSVDALPESVETVITSRIDTLAPDDRLFLRNASVLGARFELEVLDEVFAGEVEDVGDLSRWERLGEFVAWEGAGELRFVHDLYRVTAYEGMSFRRRREMHGRAGTALEQRGAEPSLLSLHFFEAERFEQAWGYAATAGDHAREQYANVVAAELYERAITSAEHLELPAKDVARVCESLGDVAILFAGYDQASNAYGRARGMIGDVGRLLRKEGISCEHRGLYDEGLEWFARAAAAAEDDETRAESEVGTAGILFRQGRFEESIETARRAAGHAEAAGERAALAHALAVLDGSLTQVGRVDPTVTERSLALYEELDDLTGVGSSLNHLGIHAYYAGQWDEALDAYRRSQDAKDRSGDVEGSAMAIHNQAEILSDQGRYDEAEPLFRDALRVARAANHRLIEAFVTANLGRVAARSRRFDEAHALLDEASGKLAAIGSGNMVLETDVRRAECLVLEGRHAEAHELAERALVRAAELGRMDTLGPQLERALGYVLHQAGRSEESSSHLEKSLRLAREANADYEIAMTLHALAETGENSATEADQLFERLGVVAVPAVPLP